jgi:magnesium-transporting ATPase (P-type)
VVTCPCALSLATPTAMVAATGALTRQGILTTRGHALETLAQVTHIIFDKTGTLSYGRPQVVAVEAVADLEPRQCLALAAALEELKDDIDEHDLDFDLDDLGFGKDDIADIEEVDKVLHGQTPAKNEKKDVQAKTSYEVRIKCRSEKHQVQILEAIESQDAGKLAKAFKGVTVDEISAGGN